MLPQGKCNIYIEKRKRVMQLIYVHFLQYCPRTPFLIYKTIFKAFKKGHMTSTVDLRHKEANWGLQAMYLYPVLTNIKHQMSKEEKVHWILESNVF